MPETSAPVPPQNLEAEESVLGAMLLSPAAVAVVSEALTARDFYRDSHRAIYEAIVDLYRRSEAIDAITVVDALEERGTLEKAGGKGRVHELASLVPATANVGHYARIVAEQATLRGLIAAGQDIARLGWDRPGDLENLVDQAERIIFGIATRRHAAELAPLSGAMRETFETMAAMLESGSDVIGLSTGFRSLDRLTLGLQPGNLIIVAARPSMGKSALALNLSANVGVRGETPVAIFSLEMSRQEIAQRMLAAEANVALSLVRTGRAGPADWNRMVAVGGRLDKAPIWVDDSGSSTMLELRSKARRLKAQQPQLGLIVVDYLQLLVRGNHEYKTAETGAVALELKGLAKDLAVPVVALAQLSRAVENRNDKRPILSDLRDSGNIEEHADLVAFLYRDDYYTKENSEQPGICEVILAKHRNGPTDTVRFAWRKEQTKFTELLEVVG